MKRLSRRNFLRLLVAGASTLAADQILIACGQQPEPKATTQPQASPTNPTTKPTELPVPTLTSQSPATPGVTEVNPTATSAALPTPAGAPDLVVVRGGEP